MFEKTMSLFKDEINNIVTNATHEKDEIIAQHKTQLAQRDETIAKLEAEISALKNATL